MNPSAFFLEGAAQAAQIGRAEVLEARADGAVLCSCEGEDTSEAWCEVLQTTAGPAPQPAPGDRVLVWLPPGEGQTGVVLGRLGGPRPAPVAETPEELVLEARKELTLRCGEGSITLRGDGKVLIKGKDLVSRAKRLNRIKGGAVAIN